VSNLHAATPSHANDPDFARGHNDTGTLPSWIVDEWPRELIGYAAAAYLAGVAAARAQLADPMWRHETPDIRPAAEL
jgi:hypothetical protein